MKKRIIICSDGTWNRPEQDVEKDHPTNVLKLARAIATVDSHGIAQQVFYDWGIGSDFDPLIRGTTGKGLHKNVRDCYRYIVHNYEPGDELFFFGFSRGAYTVRSLCGLINNCGVLKKKHANLIVKAFEHYKDGRKSYRPKETESIKFRKKYSYPSNDIAFVGVWDTVGALGIPISFMGDLDEKDEFYDNKMGPNIKIACHALAIDERRGDFEPTIWKIRADMTLKQVWFCGCHSDIGGGYSPDKETKCLLSDIPLKWMCREAEKAGLSVASHLKKGLHPNSNAKIHKSRQGIFKLMKPVDRPIDHDNSEVLIHRSVKERWENNEKYRPKRLDIYIKEYGWETLVT